MTISHQGQGQFTIKSKLAAIELGKSLKIGEKKLPGQGEFEVSGIEAEVLADGIVLLGVEDVHLLYLGPLNRDLTDQELEAVSITDLLFIPVGGQIAGDDGTSVLSADQAVKVINQIDPRIVIPMYYASLEPFRAAEGKPLELLKELKITQATLPTEERQIIALG